MVQLMPGGKVLIVSSRCRRFKDGTHDLNAEIYDSAGKLEREFLLGDGIEHVRVDRRGNIWVGYFDEGVYGNYGWGGTGDAGPVGAAGLVAFNAEGKRVWEFQPISGTDFISDVYALNVFGNEAWAYYYTDFPIVRVGEDWKVEAWTTETSGARAFAVGNGKVLLFGGYDHRRTACRSLALDDGKARIERDISLVLSDGVTLSEAAVLGRGNILHVMTDETWYQFSTDSLK